MLKDEFRFLRGSGFEYTKSLAVSIYYCLLSHIHFLFFWDSALIGLLRTTFPLLLVSVPGWDLKGDLYLVNQSPEPSRLELFVDSQAHTLIRLNCVSLLAGGIKPAEIQARRGWQSF